ncbi:arylsulfatase [Gordonia sp. X0973]|uniref:arylsulfatase n=1 Tax=Gordonia sp. X0973 TaxID=2742602 RepID=UPI000F51D057|nr:arylsulfatase [Gordonia sp. X0973]QKT08129.1 arylsulfatase [Gordonia sp. X0973]
MAAEFTGRIAADVRDSQPDWTPFLEPSAPDGAPNVLFIVWDDTGYGAWDLYGGLVEMPTMRRIADRGLRFSQFHTTALCSPTRTALLTGRNAQSSGMGTIGEMADGFPGLSCLIPRENGLLPEMLRERGYNTFAIGKWHLSPAVEMGMGGSKRTWPLSRGFDRFYGFLGGLTDQWYPDLTYDNHPVEPPARPDEGYHLSTDLADKALEFLRDSRSAAPGKPWFAYVAPGAGHAPHHAPREWSDRYAGKFSMGYERYREIVLANQKELGLLPEDTELPPLNPYGEATGPEGQPWSESDLVRAWDDLPENERRLFERQAEVYAGFLSHADHQLGRIIDFLEETDQLDNTIIVAISDNGASAEGGALGSVNENRWYNGIPEDMDLNLSLLDDLGLENTHPHYSNGWAMAFNTPFKMYKTYASVEGGVADPMVLSWPARVPARTEPCAAYVHAIDVVPTVLEAIGIDAPAALGGVEQSPVEGVSFFPVLLDENAAVAKEHQFYSMLGTRGIWSGGWHACTVHAPTPSGWGKFDADRWELYRLADDRNQLHDLAEQEPAKLAELRDLWDRLATEYNGYPLDDRSSEEILAVARPNNTGITDSLVLYPGCAPFSEHGGGVELPHRPFAITASITVDDPASAQGIIFSQGGRFGGHALMIRDGRIRYLYNWLGELEQELVADTPVAGGPATIEVRYEIDEMVDGSPHGPATLEVNGQTVAQRRIRTQPGYFSISGEGSTVGRETGQPVTADYEPPFTFRGGTIDQVVVRVGAPFTGEAAVSDTAVTAGFARD